MQAFICDGQRTPIGRYGGGLSGVRADDLAAIPISALIARNPGVDWSRLDDVILGCANQAGEDNRNVPRMAALLAGLPIDVPGMTINRLCASGLDAVGTAARAIRAGDMDLAIAGGVESMSRAPFVLGKAEAAYSRKAEIYDSTMGARFPNRASRAQFGGDVLGQSEPGEDRNAVVEVARSQCVDHLLADLGCLPRLRHVVPDVVGVQDAGDVADPRPHQVRAAGERTVHVARSPVVAQQIDLRSTRSDRVEFADQPLGVVVHRGIEPVGDRRAEARRRQRNHTRSSSLVKRCGQWTPDRGGLRVAVDEDDGALGHASRP